MVDASSERSRRYSRTVSGTQEDSTKERGVTRGVVNQSKSSSEFGGVALSNPNRSQSLTPARVHDQGARRDDVARRCEFGGVANTVSTGRPEGGTRTGNGSFTGSSNIDELAHPQDGHRRSGECGEEAGVGEDRERRRGSASSSSIDELGNTCCEGLPSRKCEAFCGERGREERRAVVQLGSPFDFWADAEWLFCTDGKARPVEPGTFPLAHGTSPDMGSDRPGEASPFRVIQDPKTGRSIGQNPWRIGMLKGYGNAIVAQAAAVFIQTIKEAIHEVIQSKQDRQEGEVQGETL